MVHVFFQTHSNLPFPLRPPASPRSWETRKLAHSFDKYKEKSTYEKPDTELSEE